ncbi:glycosyltransferase family 4 protein [Glutamicibacter uratoxydans]|nr:glycosyltransferase family 4 protein [Glutamicibacter uratoxydans]
MSKVLHVADAFEGGGAESVFRATIKASIENGDTTHVFTGVPAKNPFSYVFSFGTARRLYRELNRFRPDIIHIQNYYHSLSPSALWAISLYKNKKDSPKVSVIFTAHDYHIVSPNSGFQYFRNGERHNLEPTERRLNLFRRWDNRTWVHSTMKLSQYFIAYKILDLRKVIDMVVSPSNFLARIISIRCPEIPIKVVRNPITCSSEIENTNPKKVSVDNSKINLCFLGRVSSEKGVQEFIEVLGNTSIKRNIILHIVGSGESKILASIRDQGLRSEVQVKFHGYVAASEVPLYLKQMNILVLPSLWFENAPLVLIEAALLGIPTLTSEIGGMKELSQLTTASCAVRINDHNQVETAIQVLNSKQGMNNLIDRDIFEWSKFKDDLHDTYLTAAEGIRNETANG